MVTTAKRPGALVKRVRRAREFREPSNSRIPVVGSSFTVYERLKASADCSHGSSFEALNFLNLSKLLL
jgi:hypothetical protein